MASGPKATEMFYENLRRISDVGGSGFPRFSKKSCGGGNRNGAVFQIYNDGNRLLAETSQGYTAKARSRQHLVRTIEEARKEMANAAVMHGQAIDANLRYHQMTKPAAPDVARGTVRLPATVTGKPTVGKPAMLRRSDTTEMAEGFQPFRAFSPQRQQRSNRVKLDTIRPANDPGLYDRLAEPIMRPDRYKMEQFVPLMRTW